VDSSPASTAIVWFRRDLRIHDHPALTKALQFANVVCLFVLDDRLLHGRYASPNRAWFLQQSLLELASALAERGGRLVVQRGRPEIVVADVAHKVGAGVVFASRDYGPFGLRRDRRVAEALASGGIRFDALPGVLAVEPEAIARQQGGPFRVFGAFHRRWVEVPRAPVLPAPDVIPSAGATLSDGFESWRIERPAASIIVPGEAAARERLRSWVEHGNDGYASRRDRLDLEGSSRLSQDLRWGLLSPNEVLSAVHDEAGALARELAWRDFYHHLAWHAPRVVREPFRRDLAGLPWRDDPDGLQAWKDGRTGYPVIDAAMRQLVACGWMHNRARMIVASFLCKNLLIDYREGEAFFMQHLVDGDVALNNGGWQWSSSTGTDAQPYFRVFNPVLQGQRFDPSGTFVRHWLPELAGVPDEYVHQPWTMPGSLQRNVGVVIGRDYPLPIVPPEGAAARAREFYRGALDRL